MPNSPHTLLEFLISNIVDQKDKVEIILETDSYGGQTLKATVAKEDMGKVIGKSGKTIRAIRNLIKALAIKKSLHVNVVLTEEY